MITNIIDQNHVVVQNPEDKVPRTAINLKWVQLTEVMGKVPSSLAKNFVGKMFKEQNLQKKILGSKKVKKIDVLKTRYNSTDFDRHKLRRARRSRSLGAKKLMVKEN